MGYWILFGWLILLPICAGGILHTKKNSVSLAVQWLWGQFLLWAVFQPAAVMFILKERNLEELVPVYVAVGLVLGAAGLVNTIILWKKVHNSGGVSRFMWIKEQKLLVGIFVILWLVQMVLLAVLAVNDGDDAFYMAVANQAECSGNMYTANVYAFGNSGLNYRYALAPFPIWIAFLSRISGVHTLIIGHVVLGITLVTMSYMIYAQIGKELFSDNYRKRMQLLILIALLYIWGNTSSHTAESFLLLRSRQGKALVAGLVFPAMIYLLIKIGHALEQQQKATLQDFLLAAVIMLAGCLGSTLGGVLIILLWTSGLFFLAVGYKRWGLLPSGMVSALPGLIFAVIYLTK